MPGINVHGVHAHEFEAPRYMILKRFHEPTAYAPVPKQILPPKDANIDITSMMCAEWRWMVFHISTVPNMYVVCTQLCVLLQGVRSVQETAIVELLCN